LSRKRLQPDFKNNAVDPEAQPMAIFTVLKMGMHGRVWEERYQRSDLVHEEHITDMQTALLAWEKKSEIHADALTIQAHFERFQERYKNKEIESQKATRAQLAFCVSLFGPPVGALLPIFVPIVARFYLGVGYFQAVHDTFWDRTLSSFFTTFRCKARNLLKAGAEIADNFGQDGVASLLSAIICVLDEVNTFF